MNLEAIALRRAEEQVESFTWQPEPKERPTIRRPFQSEINRRRIRCLCGRCKTCKNRKFMRAWRESNGGERRTTCVECGRARNLHGKFTKKADPLGWCSRCKGKRHGVDYREALRENFWDGGGI